MNEKEALIYLNAKAIEELPSLIEMEVFQIKSFIFSENWPWLTISVKIDQNKNVNETLH